MLNKTEIKDILSEKALEAIDAILDEGASGKRTRVFRKGKSAGGIIVKRGATKGQKQKNSKRSEGQRHRSGLKMARSKRKTAGQKGIKSSGLRSQKKNARRARRAAR